MPAKTMENSQPVYGYRKNVFIINDIDLIVPPTNIDIQIEDLVWQWRALRSRATTKVPSGQGQISVQVTIPFTGSMVLDMHRLVVQFRHSPFCYIENRFLRESIVPHFPASQSMAFTMTGVNVAPMEGSSDTWIMQLDLTWFNYFPYVHNWLYRKDWHTVPIRGEGDLDAGSPIEATIGWDYEGGVKKQKHTLLPALPDLGVEGIRSWSSVQNHYEGRQDLTIKEMELLHRGEIFDLLPLPGRMAKSSFVIRPSESRIYTRYINLLQRDALMKNFDINVEAQIGSSVLKDGLFSAIAHDNERYTWGLHNGPPISTGALYDEWVVLRDSVARAMNNIHGGVLFDFFAYKEIRLPAEWTEMVSNAHKHSVEAAKKKLPQGSGLDSPGWIVQMDSKSRKEVSRVRVRTRFSSKNGVDGKPRSSVVGYSDELVPMPVNELRVTSPLQWRSGKERDRLYHRTGLSGRMHWGTDFGAGARDRGREDVQVPIYAVEHGTVSHIQLTNTSNGAQWKLAYLAAGHTLKHVKFDQEDFEKSIKAVVPEAEFAITGKNVASGLGSQFPVGTFVKSVTHGSSWYYVEANSAGNYIQLTHGNNLSLYMHLSSVAPNIKHGSVVEAGALIGYMGRSGPMNTNYKEEQLAKANRQYDGSNTQTSKFVTRTLENYWDNPSGERSSVWGLKGTHLHFEYWEAESAGLGLDEPWTGDAGIPEVWNKASRRVPVDMRGPIATAEPGSRTLAVSRAIATPSQSSVRDALSEEAESNSIAKESLEDVIVLLDNLWRDGWMYYDRESAVQNVWWKHHSLLIGAATVDQLAEGYLPVPTVLTAVAGGLRHVVANIPILGHEFPTQQHLGSIEPFYSFEFCSIDHEGKGTQRLAGVSKETEILLAMRGMLHANARNFRGIADAWCVSADSFVTRLLGTFSPEDRIIATYDDEGQSEEPVIADLEIKRRMISTKANSMTVQNRPGLSCHTLEFSETNPYGGESLNGTAPAAAEIEKAYSDILKAVYKLEFADGTRDIVQQVLIAQIAGANTSHSAHEDYGQFSLEYTMDPSSVASDGVALYRDSDDKDWVLMGDDFSMLANSPESINSIMGAGDPDVPALENLNAIPLEQVFGEVPQTPVNGSTMVLQSAAAQDAAFSRGESLGRNPRTVAREFNIKDLLAASQETLLIGEIPMQKILDYWLMIHKTMKTASHILAESDDQLAYGTIQAGGHTEAVVTAELYGLPVRPNLFKSYQLYLSTMAAVNPKTTQPGVVANPNTRQVLEHLAHNDNWLVWRRQFGLRGEDLSLLSEMFNAGIPARMITQGGFGTLGRWTSVVAATAVNGTTAVKRFLNLSSHDRGIFATVYAEATDDILDDLAIEYTYALPLRDLLTERFKSYVSSTMFGDMLGSVAGGGASPVFASTTEMLKKTTGSSGNFQCSSGLDFFQYLVEPYDAGGTSEDTKTEAGDDLAIGPQSSQKAVQGDKVSVPVFLPNEGTVMWWLFNKAEGIQAPNTPYVWWVDPGLEKKKLKYFKTLFARYARDLLNDFDILRAFGLQSLSRVNARARLAGAPALPDMDLPHHPYYGDVAACPPDFYMWNMYDDGDAHNEQTLTAITEVMGDVVSNCYDSLKRMQTGGGSNSDKYIGDPELTDQVRVKQAYSAEGTDSGSKGPTGFPFYPNPESAEAISDGIQKLTESAKEAAKEARAGPPKLLVEKPSDIVPKRSSSVAEVEALSDIYISDVRLSNFEGPYGQGGGVQYPRRVSADQYKALFSAVHSVDSMFGSRSGYLGQKEMPEDLEDRLRGTLIEREKDPSHRFNKDSLNQLARNSAADIFGQKRRMARAYPTFKLFFVEEDQFESRLLNFDDFYSYNGVTSFTVEQSRKSPADHAVISLLNVAGTLDGTKRDAVVDLDYFSDPKAIDIPGEASKTGGDPVNQGSSFDQPFGALVLRPGLNVQLRVGYSNDPNLLEVLLSGRVVDVTWNQGGDRAEILVQSFGAELGQAIKGTAASADARSFATTHQLLGAMMLEPELLHFGRWEFGQMYQVGEGSDARLDFKDYSREGFLGAFRATNNVTSWLLEHHYITATLAIGGAALLSRIPGAGRLLRPASKLLNPLAQGAKKVSGLGWVSRWLGTLGTQGGSAAFYRKALVDAVGSRTGAATVASTVIKADVKAAIRSNSAQFALRNIALRDAGGEAGGQFIRRAAGIRAEAIRKAASSNVDDAAKALAAGDAEIANLIRSGQWIAQPLAELSGQGVGLIRVIGTKPFKRIWDGLWFRTPALIAGTSIAALPLSGLDWAFSELYDASFGRMKAYFRTRQVSMFLSPQDDNLFAPHPKDYMEIYSASENTFWQQAQQWAIRAGVTSFVKDDELGFQASRWLSGVNPLDKRATPTACSFKLISTTIWDVFHEMSLRHPGWVYAARPYGNEFRYTMFFGVPSQRYWAVPADNEFVRRANDLSEFLGDGEVSIDEYRRLYGDVVDDGKSSQLLEDYDAGLQDKAIAAAAEKGLESTDPLEVDAQLLSIRQLTYTPKALKEYLKAMELRFKPFRRYHSITSEHDIVWNGLMSSENAVHNAVDVTYFDEDADPGDSPVSSALFKSHAFTPEHQLRILPLQPSYNCRGYQMAMRYGMGSLLHTMRDMYRGEIIVLGNPRIRPWDVGIMSDSYNDMVGPFEVEQVVHQFSHETGFVTEIKPSALVIANETSSWPVLEAMKVASLAIRDVDDQFQGLGAADADSSHRWKDFFLEFGAGGESEYREYLEQRAKELSPFDSFADPKTGESDLDAIRKVEERLAEVGVGVRDLAGIGLGLAGAGLALKGIPWIASGLGHSLGRFGRVAGTVAAGGVGLLTAGGTVYASDRLTPSLAWLLGSPILFLRALRNDSIMLVPLMKNGHPIVSGVNLTDPSMIWNNFKGELGRWADDTLDGTRDLTDLWRMYGKNAWRRQEALSKQLESNLSTVDTDRQAYAELTGEF